MWFKVVFLAIIAAGLAKLVSLVILLDLLKSPGYNQHPGDCRKLPGIDHGAEDFQLLPGDKVLISSGLRFMHQVQDPKYQARKGQVLLFDLNQPDKQPEPVKIEADDIDLFIPHGMAAWIDKDTGVITVFIVNHPHVVEKFRYDAGRNVLRHLETIGRGDNAFRVLNSIVPVSESAFYVTNCFYYSSSLETNLQLHWGSVVYYDGTSSRTVVDGLFMPDGINISPDGRFVYVSALLTKDFQIYRRHADNSLTLESSTFLNAGPDNIMVNAVSGDVLVGASTNLAAAFGYVNDPETTLSPSLVLQLKISGGHVTDIRQVMADDGRLISGCSVALRHKRTYLIGSIVSNAVICQDMCERIDDLDS